MFVEKLKGGPTPAEGLQVPYAQDPPFSEKDGISGVVTVIAMNMSPSCRPILSCPESENI